MDNQDGFEGFELLKPTDERTTWLVVTRWRDEESFPAWLNSPAFGHGHRSQAEREGGQAAAAGRGVQRAVVLRARGRLRGAARLTGVSSWVPPGGGVATPAVLVDACRLDRNLRAMAESAASARSHAAAARQDAQVHRDRPAPGRVRRDRSVRGHPG